MKVLIIGGGGREHALAWKIRQSPQVEALFCAPGNAGIATVADCVPIEPTSIIEAADFAEKLRIDLTVVGPELPLTLGVADEFTKRGLRLFGPTRAAAEIESSKVFAKEFMARHGIPCAASESFDSFAEARRHLGSRSCRYPVALKVDGLAAGKGVVIARDPAEAEAFAAEVLQERTFGTAGDRLLLEEFLEGTEASFFALCDGRRVVPLAPAQDHKRLEDGDRGPNTGGMGAFSPTPRLDNETFSRVLREIVLPTVAGLDQEGRTYRGLLYAGMMLTEEGPKVLEFNARFGDPETQAVLPRLDGDLAAALAAAADGRLENVRLDWRRDACVAVVAASHGYPGRYETGRPVEGLAEAAAVEGALIFQAGTRAEGERVLTHGGRVLAAAALGTDVGEASERAYAALGRIRFDGMTYRRDIGRPATGAEGR